MLRSRAAPFCSRSAGGCITYHLAALGTVARLSIKKVAQSVGRKAPRRRDAAERSGAEKNHSEWV